MKTYLRSFVATIVLIGALSASMGNAVGTKIPAATPAAAPAAAMPTLGATPAPTSGFTQSADSAKADADATAKAEQAKKDKEACEAPKDSPKGPDQAADQAASKAAAAAKCKTAAVNTPTPTGDGTTIATKDPTSAKDALFSNQLTGDQTGGFSKDNKVPDSKVFTASADSAGAKFETVKASTVAPATAMAGKSDVLTSKMSVNYQNYDANRVTRMVNSSDDLALAYNVAAKNNATMAVGMPVDSTDPKAPLRQAFINTMMNKYGWSAEKAAAFAGNLDHESNAFAPEELVYDPKTGTWSHSNANVGAVSQGDYDKATGKYTSAGIAQFHLDRKDGMVNFVGAANSSKSELAGTLYDQFDYVGQVDAQKTLGSKNMAALDDPNVSFKDKVGIVTDKYEIPKAVSGELYGRMGGTSRYNDAADALNEFNQESGNGGNMVVAANGKGGTIAAGGGGNGGTSGSGGSGGTTIGGIAQQVVTGLGGGSSGGNIGGLASQLLSGSGSGSSSGSSGSAGSSGSSGATSGGQYAGTETTESGNVPYQTTPLTGFQLLKAQEILKTCQQELPATDDEVVVQVARCKALGKASTAAVVAADDADKSNQ